MTTITLPDDVTLPTLARALRGIGLKPAASDRLRFDHARPSRSPGACAHPGCTRDGAIVWGDDDVAWCADHAWTQRGAL